MHLLINQQIFSLNLSQLIVWAHANYYEVTFGETYRTQEQQDVYFAKGLSKTRKSNHTLRLASDLNIFKAGKLLTSATDLQPIGKKWVSMHPNNRWGGDWNKNGNLKDEKFFDPSHFEMLNL